MKVMVSACLLNEKCRYDAKCFCEDVIMEFLKDKEVFPICPEILGGLSVPREACEIIEDKVMSETGNDYTKEFYAGSKKVVEIYKKEQIDLVILKSKSPSCGYHEVYDGTFSHHIIKGNGICARLLEENGAKIINSDEFIARCMKENKNIL